MQKFYDDVLGMVGATPMVKLNRVGSHLSATLLAKIEFLNPGGSVKDRVATAMVEKAEREGLLKPGSTIVEATSGNTGAGLAMVAAVKGYRCIFVAPDRMSKEKIRLLQAYGAEVVLASTAEESKGPDGYEGIAQRLLQEISDSWCPEQFANMANPQAHFDTTGREIWEQSEGKVTVLVSGVGTGGTISGVGRFLKEQNPAIKVVGVDSDASVLSGGEMGLSAVEGIGEDHVPQTLNAHVVDEWIRMKDRESFMVARDLARKEGLLVGGSSGAAVGAALLFAERLNPEDVVVAICPDTGRNYLSTFYNDEWMGEKGYLDRVPLKQTAGDVLKQRGSRELISADPNETAEEAIARLRKNDISQMPVFENGHVVGGIREVTVTRLLHDGIDPRKVQVREIMARPLPQVDALADVQEVYRLLMSGHSGVLVADAGRIDGIITRIDLVEFWEASRAKE